MHQNNKIGIYAHYILKNEKTRLNFTLLNDLNYLIQTKQSSKGGLYIPNYICEKSDMGIFNKLLEELSSNDIVQWSKHFKIDNPTHSELFNKLIAKLSEDFNMKIYASRINYYPDGTSWKPFHHDSHAYDNKSGDFEDITIGISLGASRSLAFKHVESGEIFQFPQHNGDIFAFDDIVNKKFMHGVPKTNDLVGSRISVIVWGKTNGTIQTCPKIQNSIKKINPLKDKMKNKRIVQ